MHDIETLTYVNNICYPYTDIYDIYISYTIGYPYRVRIPIGKFATHIVHRTMYGYFISYYK